MASFFDDITAQRSNVLDRLSAGEPVDPQEREQLNQVATARQGEFLKGLRRAGYNASATTDAFVGGMAEPVAPDYAQRKFDQANNTIQNIPNTLRPQVESFRDVNDVGSAAQYAAGALGEATTSIAGMVAAGLAARFGLGSALRLGATGKNIAQYGGSMAAMLPQEGGETALSLRNNPEAVANTTPLERAGLTLGRGALNSALESIVPNVLFTNAIAGTARRIAPGVAPALANVGRKVAAGTIGEAATEGAQEFTGQVAENIAVPGTGYDAEPIKEAAVRGAIAGSVLGGGGGTIQAVRSNLEAGFEASAEKAAEAKNKGLNAAVEKLDYVIRNPQEFGQDLTNTTMGALSEAASRAQEVGGAVADAAGPAAGKGMDAIGAFKRQFDEAVVDRLTPENTKKYAELTTNLRLLKPTEFGVLRDALNTGDADTINKAVGAVSRLLTERVPRETFEGLKNIASWAKKFGKGVTTAAREGRKASQAFTPEDVNRFNRFLGKQYKDVDTAMGSFEPPIREAVSRIFMTYAAQPQLMNPESPQYNVPDYVRAFVQKTGVELETLVADWTAVDTKQRQRPLLEATQQYGANTDRISTNAEMFSQEGIESGEGQNEGPPTYEGDEGTAAIPSNTTGMADTAEAPIYNDEGQRVDVETKQTTPLNSLGVVQRVLAKKIFRRNGTVKDRDMANEIPSVMTSDELTPQEIGSLMGDRVGVPPAAEGAKWGSRYDPMTPEQLEANLTPDKKGYIQHFNAPDLAAQAGTPEDAGGSKEAFEQFIPDFTDLDDNYGIQGKRMLAMVSAINTDGISVPRAEIPQELLEARGMDAAEIAEWRKGDDIKINVSLGVDDNGKLKLSRNLKVQVGAKASTVGDLDGSNRVARSLVSQQKLLRSLSRNRGPQQSRVMTLLRLSRDVDAEGETLSAKTADATLRGLKSFTFRTQRAEGLQMPYDTYEQDAVFDSYVGQYYANLEERIADTERKRRDRRNEQALSNAVVSEYTSSDDIRDAIDVLTENYTPAERDIYRTVYGPPVPVEAADDTSDARTDRKLNTPENVKLWVEDLELEVDSTDDLVQTLIEFRDGAMREYEIRRAKFDQEIGTDEPTERDRYEAWRKDTLGRMTTLEQRGINRQNDAAVRRRTPMTVTQHAQLIKSVPPAIRALYEERIMQDTAERQKNQLEFDFPFTSPDGRTEFLSLEHWVASHQFPRDYEKNLWRGEIFRPKAYADFLQKYEAQQAAQAARDERVGPGRIELQRAEQAADAAQKAELERVLPLPPRSSRTPAATYPVMPLDGTITPARKGWSKALSNALKEAQTLEEVDAVQKTFVERAKGDREGIEGIKLTAQERRQELKKGQSVVKKTREKAPVVKAVDAPAKPAKPEKPGVVVKRKDETMAQAQARAMGQQPAVVSEPVNVWAGTNENAELSNLAFRPFTHEGREYLSVEHAYQSLKTGAFDQKTYDKYQNQLAKNGTLGKIRGGRADIKDGANVKLMSVLMQESFEQNPDVLEILRATGDRPITHTQDKGIWKTAFPRILMKIRDEGTPAQAAAAPAPVVGTTTVRVLPLTAIPKAEDANNINVLRKPKTDMHYGNPFGVTGKNTSASVPNAGTVEEVTLKYVEWLKGEKHQDVEPGRRAWIQKKIASGALKGKNLLYFQDTKINHAKALAALIDEGASVSTIENKAPPAPAATGTETDRQGIERKQAARGQQAPAPVQERLIPDTLPEAERQAIAERVARFTVKLERVESEQDLDQLQEWVNGLPAGSTTITELELFSRAIEQRRENIKTQPKAYVTRLLSGSEFKPENDLLMRIVNNWSRKYLDGAEVRVAEFDPNDKDVKDYFYKVFGSPPRGRAIPPGNLGPGSPAVILINKNMARGGAGTKYSRMHVLAHEFGHIIELVALKNAPDDVKASIDSAYKRAVTDTLANEGIIPALFKAGSALRFIPGKNTNATLTHPDATTERGMKQLQKGAAALLKDTELADNILTFREWFAEQFAKYALNEPSVFAAEDNTVREYIDGIIAAIKKYYNEVIKKVDRTTPEFDDYMKWLGTPAAERGSFTDYDPQQWDVRDEAGTQDEGPPPPPPPEEGTTAQGDEPKRKDFTSNTEFVQAHTAWQGQQPPKGPPTTPPRGPQRPPPPPPPPPDNDAQARFRAIIEKLLGKRVLVEFGATTLGEGVGGEYVPRYGQDLEDTKKALGVVHEKRRSLLREIERVEKILRDPNNKIPIDELGDPASMRQEIALLEKEAAEYRADIAIRGTIRVAAGMEAQAGLAEHEAFHAAFDFFFGEMNAADRKVIGTAFTKGIVARRLQNYYKDNADVLAVIDPTSQTFRAEEAAAYGFQVYLHDPGALQLGEKLEGIFNRFLAYLRNLVGYKTYEERAQMILDDFASGKRAERGVSSLRDNPSMERSMLERSQHFVKEIGTGAMHLYDAILTSSYSRLADSGNPAMAQIARLGYNATGETGQGMIQLQRLHTTQFSNQMKDGLHALDADELHNLGQAMLLNEPLPAGTKLGEAQKKLRAMYAEAHKYQKAAGINVGFRDNYYPMIWSPDKVAADPQGFLKMLENYPKQMAELKLTPTELRDSILAWEERGHEFQGIFGQDGEPVADSSRRMALDFITNEDRLAFMEDNVIDTTAHYLNQAVRHAEYVRAYGENANTLKQLMGEIKGTYGGTQADVNLAQDFIDGLMGNKEIGMSRELKDLYGAAIVYQNVRLLPLTAFSSLVDPLGIGVRTQSATAVFDTFAYSMRNMFTDFRNKMNWTPDQWEKYAGDVGTVDMSGTVKSIDKIFTGVTLRGKTREINDGFFKWNLLNGLVKNHHIMATKYAQMYLRRSAEGMFGEKDSAENLQEAGVSQSDIVYDEKLGRIRTFSYEILGYEDAATMELEASKEEITEARAQADRIQQAVHKIVRQSLIQPSSAEQPGWMSNPYLAPIAHLKTFVFGFNATILQRLLYEAKRGNYSPLFYAAAYVPGMIAADFVRGFAGNGGDEPEWKKHWTMGDYLSHGVQRSGLTGTGQFFMDMNNDVTRGGGGWEQLSGPTIEQAHDLMRAMAGKTSQPVGTWMVDALPANDLYNQWVND